MNSNLNNYRDGKWRDGSMSFTVKHNLRVVGLRPRQVTNVFVRQLERIANFSTDHNI